MQRLSFESNLLDQDWDNLYKTEDRFGKFLINFSGLSIIISCLGLFGFHFCSTATNKRIGRAQVMGASVPGLMQLMAKEFAWLVLIAVSHWRPFGCSDGLVAKTYAYHVDWNNYINRCGCHLLAGIDAYCKLSFSQSCDD